MGDNTEREISTGFTLASVWNKEDIVNGRILEDMIKSSSLSYRSVMLMFQLMVLCNGEISTGGQS